jgi:hypothetical protein
VFYTYCWVLKNCELLGSTGANIVCCGDSAGANLNTACVIKCIEMGIPTVKGIFNAYSPFLVNFAQTPARYLVVQDPLIPYGFIMRIFKTYGSSVPVESGGDDENGNRETYEVQDENDNSTLLSPESSKSLEAIWQKVKSSEEPDWHSNLNSIQEISSEEPVSPLVYRSDSLVEPNFEAATNYEDEDGLEMKIDEKKEVKEEKAGDFVDDFVKK